MSPFCLPFQRKLGDLCLNDVGSCVESPDVGYSLTNRCIHELQFSALIV